MASERDDCIDKIVRASGGKLSRDEATEALDEILSRAESKGQSWKSIDENLAEVAQELKDAALEHAAVQKRNERLDALKSLKRHKYYDRAPNPSLGMEAKLVGINSPFAGNRLSVDAQYKAIRRHLIGGFVLDLERAGVDKIFASRQLEREWATELAELNKEKGGKPGITNSKPALEIAQALHKWQKVSIDSQNSEGAWIKSYSGYITRTSHDPDKIRRAGGFKGDAARDKWVEDVFPRIDVKRSFHDADPGRAKQLLRELWGKFMAGDHFDYTQPVQDLTDAMLQVDFARKASAPRELHFKTADDWLAYNEIYGQATATQTVMQAFERASKTTALLREFGSQPRLGFEEDVRYLKAKFEGKDERLAFDNQEHYFRNAFAQFDGTANRPVNRTLARVTTGILWSQRIAKLGLTPFAMIQDVVTKASELRYQGMNFFEQMMVAPTGYFQGAKGSAKKDVADLLYTGIAARIGDITARFDGADTPAGWMSRTENLFFKITGISPMTFNQRADAEAIMSRHMGMQRGKSWEKVGNSETRILKQFEIQKAEWDLLHKVEWNVLDGTTYLTPEVAKRLSNADVRAYLEKQGTLPLRKGEQGELALDAKAKQTLEDFIINKTRGDIGIKLASYFSDRGEYAVLEVGARERAKLYGGNDPSWAPGTVKGSALRLLMQFKQFPAAMITKTWGREIYGGQSKFDKVAGLTELIVFSTAAGVLANFLNQLVKGQDPISQWKNNPMQALIAGFTRGGAGTIYGDFVVGEWSRFGASGLNTLAGPTFGQFDKLLELYSDITHAKGKQAGALALRSVRENLPFMNMIYTKAAFDYLIYYRLAEWMSPGYLERMERTMKDHSGVEFLLRPSQVSR